MGKNQNNIIGIVSDSHIQQNANGDDDNLRKVSIFIDRQLSNTDRELNILQNNLIDLDRSRQSALAGKREAYADIQNFIAAISSWHV